MLDTNVISHLVDLPTGPTARKLRTLPEGAVGISVIVAAEVRFGIEKRRAQRLLERTEAVLAPLTVFAFDAPADQRYAELRAALERKGLPIGGNDMFIAAHALALDAVLVTDNEREFRRVPGLRVENWLRA